ncbi:putative fatty acyl-CoA reductase CG5065 [Leguminivora glycinivorella]|uniref:putative fatty acyl-CoA reductase CG5065 n=1 Tax=Leguminivora glycinivorella TaxID=1035111 RepID=UPI00200BD369|nr:putative fatty acyl-CoA reductase CG5065 [Leguminivora glycinivorella]
MVINNRMEKWSVREWYSGRGVLVTGGAGFMGKVLVEKLLRAAPDVGRVFLLLRPNKGKTVQQRLDDMLRSPMFNRIRNERKEVLEKLVPIQGDITFEDLGMSSEDMEEVVSEVSVVFHLAASLRLEAPLADNAALNLAGTRHALAAARRLPHLAVFVHVSTAFCYPEYKVLDEKIHSPPAEPDDVLRLCEWLDARQLALLEPTLLGAHPNTYTYTKRLAESLVHAAYPELSCVIARPSIVCPAVSEPLPGWVDSLNGPVGILLGACKGVIRSMLCDARAVIPIIPVDYVINGLLALAAIEGNKQTRSKDIPIYNLNSGDKKSTTWGEVLLMGRKYHLKHPLAWPLWYPHLKLTTNRFVHETRRFLFHLAPAYLIDFLRLLACQKRVMVKIQEKVTIGLNGLQFFTMREWHFPCTNFDSIPAILSEEDNKLLPTHEDFDGQQYMNNTIEAGRVYCFKEDPAKVPFNRMYINFLLVLDTLAKVALGGAAAWALAAWGPAPAPLFNHVPLLGRAFQPSN